MAGFINPTALFSGETRKEAPGKRTSLQLHTKQPKGMPGYVSHPLAKEHTKGQNISTPNSIQNTIYRREYQRGLQRAHHKTPQSTPREHTKEHIKGAHQRAYQRANQRALGMQPQMRTQSESRKRAHHREQKWAWHLRTALKNGI